MMAAPFWIAVEWVLSQRASVEWKADYLRRLGLVAQQESQR